MGRLSVFNFITLNGYYKDASGDTGWHRHGPEEDAYAAAMLTHGSTLLFGRVTYEMMAGFWPTPLAREMSPAVAEGMNSADKIVFSRTLQTADWDGTRLVKDHIIKEVKGLKAISGKDMTLLGSGSILTLFAEAGLVDEYKIMIDPVALGDGTPLLKGMRHKLDLKLTRSQIFKSGIVLLCYEPA